ncbi:MAG TPA: c-type cytochrome [Candidatus Binatia bacterium]|nr:c-type cytochrome [Candidatus Binatia bacterium]
MAAVPGLRCRGRRTGGAVAAGALALASVSGCGGRDTDQRVPQAGDAARGAIVMALAGGCGCHTPKEGPVGSGGVEIATPFGTFYSTNITPDPKTGVGEWSDAEIEGAIRRGVLRDGSVESPVMPYFAYAGMADADVRDLIAYLRTLPPAERANRAAEPKVPLPRLAYRAWRLLFGRGGAAPAAAPVAGLERGRYLTEHVAICGDCHTPRNRLGTPDRSLALAGVSKRPGVPFAPNITPDVETGIGKWDAGDIANLLATGFKPDFDNVQGAMAEVIDGVAGGPGYGKAPEPDLRAIAEYVKTVPPIHHVPKDEDDGGDG